MLIFVACHYHLFVNKKRANLKKKKCHSKKINLKIRVRENIERHRLANWAGTPHVSTECVMLD